MTLYENVATSSLINMFESPQRSYYKTKVVYDFLLSKNDYIFEDIESVEEQKKENETIPDFAINLKNSKKITFEVKINNAPLTSKEGEPENRDVFLIPYNYPDEEKIKELSSSPKILYWEELFDTLDEQNIEIDALDKVRNVIEYPKVKLREKILEIFLNFITMYPEIKIDLENSKFENEFYVVLILNEETQVTITNESDKVEKEKLYIKSDENIKIMSIKELKRTQNVTEIAQRIYEALYENLHEKVEFNWKVPTNSIYKHIIKDMNNKYHEIYTNGNYYLSNDHYAYIVYKSDMERFEIGFGFGFSGKQQTALGSLINEAREIIEKIMGASIQYNKFDYAKWIGFYFKIDTEENNNEDEICKEIEKAMGIMITRGSNYFQS